MNYRCIVGFGGLTSILGLAAALGAGCGGGKGSGFGTASDGGGDDGGIDLSDAGISVGVFPPIPGLVSLTLAPATATLNLVYGGGNPATQSIKATAKMMDGSTPDVSAMVNWNVDVSTADASGGAFSTSSPGVYHVTATSGSISASATIIVKITGDIVAAAAQGAKAGLDGTAASGPVTVAYPLDGAMFPAKFAPLEFQLDPHGSAAAFARVAFTGDVIDLRVYDACAPIAGSTAPGGCSITLPPELESILEGASSGDKFTTTVRVGGAGGAGAAESAPIDVRWSTTQLNGGLYFWSSNQHVGNELMRFDLDKPSTPPEVYFSDSDTKNVAPASQYYNQCFGCHAISPDGKKLAMSFGGSVPANFALIDVATKVAITDGTNYAAEFDPSAPFSEKTTFSPDGNDIVTTLRGTLTLRKADATLAAIGPGILGTKTSGSPMLNNELATDPFWSPKGDKFVFATWVSNGGQNTGDIIDGAQVWISDVAGTTFSNPKLLVPRKAGETEYYPVISDDSQIVVFNESDCSGPPTPGSEGWGGGACDSYDDPSAHLRIVSAAGGTAVTMAKASGNSTWTNSWPRFAPKHGTFNGKSLYWVAFSSRRPYGLRLQGSPTGMSSPQLWFAAIAIDPSGTITVDPSFAPVWMPSQNADPMVPRGNHVPQWVTKVVPIIIK